MSSDEYEDEYISKDTRLMCKHCGKRYKRKSNYEQHVISCEYQPNYNENRRLATEKAKREQKKRTFYDILSDLFCCCLYCH
jgi:hypothetical protein